MDFVGSSSKTNVTPYEEVEVHWMLKTRRDNGRITALKYASSACTEISVDFN